MLALVRPQAQTVPEAEEQEDAQRTAEDVG
jgi:hypothetical protein